MDRPISQPHSLYRQPLLQPWQHQPIAGGPRDLDHLEDDNFQPQLEDARDLNIRSSSSTSLRPLTHTGDDVGGDVKLESGVGGGGKAESSSSAHSSIRSMGRLLLLLLFLMLLGTGTRKWRLATSQQLRRRRRRPTWRDARPPPASAHAHRSSSTYGRPFTGV